MVHVVHVVHEVHEVHVVHEVHLVGLSQVDQVGRQGRQGRQGRLVGAGVGACGRACGCAGQQRPLPQLLQQRMMERRQMMRPSGGAAWDHWPSSAPYGDAAQGSSAQKQLLVDQGHIVACLGTDLQRMTLVNT